MNTIKMRKGRWLMNAEPDEKGREKGACLWFEVSTKELGKYIEEGPAGISVLCFLGGLATTLIGILGLLNFGYGLTSPFAYVLNAYLVAFGIVTFLLEADVESMRKLKFIGRFSPWVEGCPMEVFNRANFLTELRGRGFFYLFIGTLAVTQCFVCLTFVAGLWNMLMGILCLLKRGCKSSSSLSVMYNFDAKATPAPEMLQAASGRLTIMQRNAKGVVEAVSAAAKSIGWGEAELGWCLALVQQTSNAALCASQWLVCSRYGALAYPAAPWKQPMFALHGASRAANAVEAPEDPLALRIAVRPRVT
eukprot:s7012_g2.t1